MYLIDTNILIYYLANQSPAITFIQNNPKKLYISTMSVIEVLSYNFASPNALQSAEDFLKADFIWLDMDDTIVYKTAEIRRLKKTKTPDAIIGATALIHGLTLVTNNIKDFKHLDIMLINPYDP